MHPFTRAREKRQIPLSETRGWWNDAPLPDHDRRWPGDQHSRADRPPDHGSPFYVAGGEPKSPSVLPPSRTPTGTTCFSNVPQDGRQVVLAGLTGA
jgi:hypothetical protein